MIEFRSPLPSSSNPVERAAGAPFLVIEDAGGDHVNVVGGTLHTLFGSRTSTQWPPQFENQASQTANIDSHPFIYNTSSRGEGTVACGLFSRAFNSSRASDNSSNVGGRARTKRPRTGFDCLTPASKGTSEGAAVQLITGVIFRPTWM